MKQITEIDDPRLVKALAHPLRVNILRVLQNRIASPSELAAELSAPLGNVSYHVRSLQRVGLLELVRTQPRRGAVEHYYRAIGRPRITDKAWAQVPRVVKDAMVSAALDQAFQYVAGAAAVGGFDRTQANASRRAMLLDEQGFSELAAAAKELLDRAESIERQSARRIKSSDHAAGEIETGLVVMLFEGASQQDRPAQADKTPRASRKPARARTAVDGRGTR